MENRENKCVDVINDLMGFALGSVYVKKVFDDESIEEVNPQLNIEICLVHFRYSTIVIDRLK